MLIRVTDRTQLRPPVHSQHTPPTSRLAVSRQVIAHRFGTPPRNTDGWPPPYFPYLVVPMSSVDNGDRPTILSPDLGPDCPSVWFESYEPDAGQGQAIVSPRVGGTYQIAINIQNQGNAPAFAIGVDFLEWTSSTPTEHVYSFVSTVRSKTAMDHSQVTLRSGRWTPAGHDNLTTGDIIVRVFDVFDAYRDTGYYLYVTNDRHLAHRSF